MNDDVHVTESMFMTVFLVLFPSAGVENDNLETVIFSVEVWQETLQLIPRLLQSCECMGTLCANIINCHLSRIHSRTI